MGSNTFAFASDPSDATAEDKILVVKEDRVTVSRSKLEYLKHMADDEKLQELPWSLDRILGMIGSGFFFAGLGNYPSFANLDKSTLNVCYMAIAVGLVIATYGFLRDYLEVQKRKKFRSKLSKEIDGLIIQMNTMAAIDDSQTSDKGTALNSY